MFLLAGVIEILLLMQVKENCKQQTDSGSNR
jgi:hypothetical protein